METTIDVELRGAPWRLYKGLLLYAGQRKAIEVLIEGPGGTGKSRGIGHMLFDFCHRYPGLRVLVVRKTRASLTEAFLKTWEQDVVPPGDPMLDGATRANRHSYIFENGSEVVTGGLDHPTRLYSTDYDIVYVQEATELSEDEWERFYRALRNWGGGIGFQLLLGDCNPDAPGHWLNRRCEQGKTKRMLSRHRDNPKLWSDAGKDWTEEGRAYIGGLERLTGVRRRRLLDGQWCAAAGAVWETFDPAVHLINMPRKADGSFDASALGIESYVGAQDWGFSSPGCFQVWGVDRDKRVYRVAEWYASGQMLEWWCARHLEAAREFKPMDFIVADCADPQAIATANVRLHELDENERPVVVPFDKINRDPSSTRGALVGLDLVRERFTVDATGKAHIYFLRDASRWRDETLIDAGQPWMTEHEIPSLVYMLDDAGHPLGERVDPKCVDHGCDDVRQMATWVWPRDLSPDPAPRKARLGSIASQLRQRNTEAMDEWLDIDSDREAAAERERMALK